MSAQHNIPSDLREYLIKHPGIVLHLNPQKRPNANVENVQLATISELKFTNIPLDTGDYTLNHGEFLEDPYLNYSFPAISIIARELDNRFGPEGILVWFPDLGRYGTWDDTHYIIYTFPFATWANIIESPFSYINAQWEPIEEEHELFCPWRDQGIPVNMERFKIKNYA